MLDRRPLGLIWGLVFIASLAVSTRSAHFSKEFVSAGREAARSMEPNYDLESQSESNLALDVSSVLCGKYKDWTEWTSCNKKCEQTRVRRCGNPEECGRTWVKEKRTCARERGSCSPLSYKIIGMQRRNRMIEEILYDLLYHSWTSWGSCTRSCRQRRQRKCRYKRVCERSYIQEERRCQVKGSKCEHRFSLKPVGVGVDHGRNDSTELDVDDGDGSDEDTSYQNWISKVENALFGEDGEQKEDDNSGHEIILEEENDDDFDKESDDKEDRDFNVAVKTLPGWSAKQGKKSSRSLRRKCKKKLARDDGSLGMPRKCGIRPKQTSGSYRVVGGQEVRKNSWPWQVAITTRYHEQYCGGTLIAQRWVLTAAHCVRKNGKRRRLLVKVGEHDTDGYDVTESDISPEKEFPHPDFDYHTITNDIALIKLRHAPPAFSLPGYACLPKPTYSPPRKRLCTIVGWGKVKSSNVHGSEALHEAQVPVVRHRKCQRVFEYNINLNQVCAGYKNGGTDSCAGDSGGPLLCKDDSGHYVLYGVTSYGEGCGLKGKYGIYSRVTSFLPWIYKTIKENS